MIRDLIARNRSIRRFDASVRIEKETLRELVSLARLSGSAANRQPLKFMLSCDAERNALIFPQTGWAAYLTDWPGPAPDEAPAAYIIILGDTRISSKFECDTGIAAQSMLLGAVERGLGGCMIGSIKRDALRGALSIPMHYEILLILALGKPAESVLIEDLGRDGDIRYWRDEAGVHHVPKRGLDELILG